jgi:hypothetical protein
MLLMILLDGFRHDYLPHTTYLRNLADVSLLGTLKEPFGFCPRAAYFGGIEPSQSGFTNMFWLDPENSPFSLARFLDQSAVRTIPSLHHDARIFIEREARSRCSPFTASYISSLAIPLSYLHLFDVAEKAAPWEPGVGYRSVFHALDEKRVQWFDCCWPEYRGLKDTTDSSILRYSLEQIRSDHTLAFIHFNSLDGIGHVPGPGSPECIEAIENLDGMVQRLVHHCSQCHDALDLMIFGDHGMVTIARNFDISRSINESGLTPCRDYYYFIDSTMVRFWFVSSNARKIMENHLSSIPAGSIVDDRMRYDLGFANCDPRNGDLFFLAHPGIQFFPNFFQATGKPPNGMHGYHPDCPDNQALFLVHQTQQKTPARITSINATQVFHTCCDLLELDTIRFDKTLSTLHSSHRIPQVPRFSISTNPDIGAVVQNHLDLMVEEIRQTAPGTQAVILTGAFGRGEGSVLCSEGPPRPLNDYDVLVACDEGFRPHLKFLGKTLAARIGIDYVDLGPLDPNWFDKLCLTMFTFDLKYGSETLWGDGSLLESIPRFAPSEIPLEEGYKLLQNRISGLLIGLRPNLFSSPHRTPSESFFLIHQIVKAAIAIGDFHLLTIGEYCSSYRQRLERLFSLRHALDIDQDLISLLERAYKFKLLPDYSALSPADSFLFSLLPHLKSCILFAITRLFKPDVAEMCTLSQALSVRENHCIESSARKLATLHSALTLLVFSIQNNFVLNGAMLQEVLSRYRFLHDDPSKIDNLKDLTELNLYSQLRSDLLEKWETQCH